VIKRCQNPGIIYSFNALLLCTVGSIFAQIGALLCWLINKSQSWISFPASNLPLVSLFSWRLSLSSVGVFGHLGVIIFSKGGLQIYSDAAKFSKRRLVSFFIRSLEN
jgi:hypothetical protein